jgi:esterase/lipase
MSRSLLFFPEKPEWDVQTMRVAAQAMYGGADVFECFEVVAAIHRDGLTEEAWRHNWSTLGESLVAGDASGADVGPPTAKTVGERAARASNYFRTAEFFVPFENEQRKTLFDKSRAAFRSSIPHLPVEVDVIAVPDGDVEYDGYVFRGCGASAANPGPGVVLLGGADSYAEELFFFGGCALAERGMTVIVADTPGRGSTLRHKGVISRPDYEHPAGKVLDALEALDFVDPRRMGLVGLSLGGYYAPRLAAFDARVRALVCWCACFDVLADIYDFCEPIQPQLTWIVGAKTDAEARERLAAFRLDEVASRITCPTLISHGAADTIIDVQSAQRLYDEVGATDKHLRIWPADGGGGDHCNYDAWPVCLPYMFDWLAARLESSAT